MTRISKRQRTHIYIYINSKKIAKHFYKYTKPDTFQNRRQFAVRLYSQKARHFTLRIFHEFFEIGIYIYTKS